ncbi:Actin-related protein 2/3 complex subunit 5 [Diplonema papillatum]|nr:Actin-related protein 2/3 complex subunit 5 [Diplonema papillatum]
MSLASKLDALKDTPFSIMSKPDANPALNLLLKVDKESKIEEEVKDLSTEQLDILMKVIYKGLASGKNSNTLFKWHGVVADVGGQGCIIRTLTDKAPEADVSDEED